MGKLNILHHKSWHVYKRENRERVLKDEQEHLQKLEKLEETRKRDEREDRISKLRNSKQEFTLFPETFKPVTDSKNPEKIKGKEPWYLNPGSSGPSLKNTQEKIRQDPLNTFKESKETEKKIKKSKKNTIEELRRQRLEREEKEAQKSLQILRGKSSSKDASVEEYKKHERDQDYYHSQFNREFKKQRK